MLPAWLDDSVRRDPIRFVDVGARGGWQRKWRAHSDHVLFIGVEADKQECARLRAQARPNERFIDQGLYHSDGEVSLYHCDPPSLTSIYRPDPRTTMRIYGTVDAARVTRVERIAVTTFDRAIAPLAVGTIDFVKLDTQGSELDILRGADHALAGPMVGLEIEVEFVSLYEGQPLFPDVSAYLFARSFSFIDFLSTYSAAWVRFGRRGMAGYKDVAAFVTNWIGLVQARGGLRGGQRLVYGDALFLREPAAWLTAVRAHGDPSRALALRGLLAVCILGYYEHATEIANLLRDERVLAAGEHASALSFIAASVLSWNRAKGDLVRVGRRLAHRVRHLSARQR